MKDKSTDDFVFVALPFTFLAFVFLRAVFSVPDDSASVAIVVISVLVAVSACSFALSSISGSNQAKKEIAKAK